MAANSTALVIGASGLIGKQLLQQLLSDPRYTKVHALVRKPLGVKHAKLIEHAIDFDTLADTDLPKVDQVFCCLGTTIKMAGSQDAFRRVDHDYVLACAKAARKAGANHFLLISALGAASHSTVFYNRVKGETEADVSALAYPSVTLLRPSMLSGDRSEFRAGERITLALTRPLSALIPAKYRPVADVTVARAMIDAATRAQPGVEIIESDQIQKFR